MRRAIWLGAALLALGSAPVGWAVIDRLESDNAFCVSCHLEPGRPLHEQKASQFETSPAQNLAAAHRVAREEFTCIECHGGTGVVGRLRIKVVSARDALRYVLGRFEEPQTMRHPLWDEDCARCHRTYRAERDDAFHALAVHNVDLPHACVECHETHPTGAPAELNFLARETVLPICRNCHKEF
jgi:predicted CXXCH cytochrome family protein